MTIFLGQFKEKNYIQNHDLRAEIVKDEEVLNDYGTDHTSQSGETNLRTAKRLERDFKIYTLNSTTVNETTIENMTAVRDHLTNNTMDPSTIKEINKIFNESILPKLEKAKTSTPLTLRKVVSAIWNIGVQTISALFRATAPRGLLDVEVEQNVPQSNTPPTKTSKTPTPQPTLETPKPTIDYPTIKKFNTKFPEISKAILARFSKTSLSELSIKQWGLVRTAFTEASMTLIHVEKSRLDSFLKELKAHSTIAMNFHRSSPSQNGFFRKNYPEFSNNLLRYSFPDKPIENFNPEEWNFITHVLIEYVKSGQANQTSFIKNILIEKFESEFNDMSNMLKSQFNGRSIGQLNKEEVLDFKMVLKKDKKMREIYRKRDVFTIIENIASELGKTKLSEKEITTLAKKMKMPYLGKLQNKGLLKKTSPKGLLKHTKNTVRFKSKVGYKMPNETTGKVKLRAPHVGNPELPKKSDHIKQRNEALNLTFLKNFAWKKDTYGSKIFSLASNIHNNKSSSNIKKLRAWKNLFDKVNKGDIPSENENKMKILAGIATMINALESNVA